jgi:Cytochrome c554 and c-prime
MIPILLVALLPQQIDAVHYMDGRRSGALYRRVENAAEVREFQRIEKARNPVEKRTLAEAFVTGHPASWLLAAVYQAAASAGLELNDPARALEAGRTSLRLLPENAPLLAVMAQVESARGERMQAVRDARDALLWLNLFAPPVGVSDSAWKKTAKAVDESARAVLAEAGEKAPVFEAHAGRGAAVRFAGSAACRVCHLQEFEAWAKTGMASMLRPIAEAALLPDFSQPVEYSSDGTRVSVRAGGGKRPYFELPQSDGLWKRYRVDYVIGSKWQQAFATRLGDERLFVFPIQYSAIEKKWINYWAAIDPPGSERADTAAFSRLASATNYQRNCAACHTSQLRLRRLDDPAMERAEFSEPGVNCEMCHGPSAAHAASPASPAPLRFSKLDHVEATLVCGQCHRQSALRNLGPNGEMNFTRNEPYYDRLTSQPYGEFGARAFYKDGRFRETTFIGEAFLRSACFRRGTAQCASCHNPHPLDAGRANPVSLKFRDDPDRMCTQCHLAAGALGSSHTHHSKESAGSRCVACHMPPIMSSLRFQAASHQIDDIPRADLTMRFGQAESPNACLICHTAKEPRWVEAEVKKWKMAPH